MKLGNCSPYTENPVQPEKKISSLRHNLLYSLKFRIQLLHMTEEEQSIQGKLY